MTETGAARTAEAFFHGSPQGLAIFNRVNDAVDAIGPATTTVSKSQVAFRRRRGFAFVWRPGQYIASDVPAVLSFALDREVASPRFKSVVHPSAHVWMHHIELRDRGEVDDQVCGWLREAYDRAG